ncbi:MAG: hypothetical protein AAFO69_08090 [Bacteroidota bacterium]
MTGQFLLLLLSCGTLGIFLGAQIAEAVLLVPYWKALSAESFFDLHQTYGKKIHRFFAPLTIAATLCPLVTASFLIFDQSALPILSTIMGLSALAFFSTYFLYFKAANKRFADKSIAPEALPEALERWGNWHWARIGFELIAFLCSLLLLGFF